MVMGVLTNSLGIISEALHSGLDLVAASITYVAVHKASKGPDEDHMYGHGKVESFAALVETVILWFTAGWIVYEAMRRIDTQEWPAPTLWGIVVMVVSLVVDYERSHMLYSTAHRHHSQALEADALHFRTDMISSAVVLSGLGCVWAGIPIADPLAAIGVSVVILVVSLELAKKAYDELIDTAPRGIRDDVLRAVSSVPGVRECVRVRVRGVASKMFVDLVVSVDEAMPVAQAHTIAERIEEEIAALDPRADVVVHLVPASCDNVMPTDTDIYSQLRRLAKETPEIASIHNVRVNVLGDGVHVAAHIELPDDMSLVEAHSVSEEFESRLREMTPEVKDITLHLETTGTGTVEDVVVAGDEGLVEEVRSIVEGLPAVRSCGDIVVSRGAHGLKVALTCVVDSHLSLLEGHSICDEIERQVRTVRPDVHDVLVHVEPAPGQ